MSGENNDPPSLSSLTESEVENSLPHDSYDSLDRKSDPKSQSTKTQQSETTTTITTTITSHSAITAALLALVPREHIQLPRKLTPRTSDSKSVASQKQTQSNQQEQEQQEKSKRKVHFSEPLVSFTITHSKSDFDDVVSLLSVDEEFEHPVLNTNASDNNDFDIESADDLRETLALESSDTSSESSGNEIDNSNDNGNDQDRNNNDAVLSVSPAAESAPQNISQPRRGLRRAVSKAARPFVDELDFLRASRGENTGKTATTPHSSSISPATPPRSILKVGLPPTNATASVSPNRTRYISAANSSSMRRSSAAQHSNSNSFMMLSLNSLSPSTTGTIRSAQMPHSPMRGRMGSSPPASTSGLSPPGAPQLARSSSSSALNRKRPTHISKTGYEQRAMFLNF
ncbi:hypothetical protein HK100_009933 [Physocladia obscura]|uniref:Uncharacterized protein n=1 Tax=Physocladia obscura TaxID=109957 RepID=A0AAD5T2Y9_9FUNG|nr:hypothetical protein HK100_009933 [Physocladia obscura]